MTTRSEATDGGTATSPWPLLVAVGLALSELGILIGFVPLAVAGLVLFGGSGAGLVDEAGYGSSLATATLAAGGLFLAVGAGLWVVGVPTFSLPTLLAPPGDDAVARRGLAFVIAGSLLTGLGIARSRRWVR